MENTKLTSNEVLQQIATPVTVNNDYATTTYKTKDQNGLWQIVSVEWIIVLAKDSKYSEEDLQKARQIWKSKGSQSLNFLVKKEFKDSTKKNTKKIKKYNCYFSDNLQKYIILGADNYDMRVNAVKNDIENEITLIQSI